MRISPSMGVSLLALLLSLGSVGYAANGGALLMGLVNSATARTYLGANYNGTAMQLANTSTAAAATALSLSVAATRPPMIVNSSVRVTNLNADYLDGIDATAFPRVRRVSFTLAPGASTAPIALPANLAVHVMGTDGNCVGGATMFSIAGTVLWSGADSCSGNNSVEHGSGNDVGHFIFYLEGSGGGDCPCGLLVEVAAGGGIRVHNTLDSGSYTGELTLVW